MKKITVAVTVDDRLGIAFNKRRQSSDKLLIKDLVESSPDKIYISEYSLPLFQGFEDKVEVVEDPIKDCPSGGCCFVEMMHLSSWQDEIESLIIYRWNRHYPSDKMLDIDLSGNLYKLRSAVDFVGNSHENITKEIYVKAE